jgi:RNA polymerase sigma-70 factor (sigma-E family)
LRRAELDEDFREWAQARQTHLRRSAYLLCRDWHLAEDLTQTTLAKLYAVWHRVRDSASRDAYARRALYRAFIDETRRPHRREHTQDRVPEIPAPASDSDLRLALLDAVAHLPPRSRAVIVLRFWEDLSVEDTAAALGCTAGTVKSQTSRGLAALRERLGGDAAFAGMAAVFAARAAERGTRHDTAPSAARGPAATTERGAARTTGRAKTRTGGTR